MTFKSPIIPYLLRAAYDWIADARLTPYIEIETDYPGMDIPLQFNNERTIVLNIAPQAVNRLKIDNQAIEFDARFGSQVSHLYIPMPAIIAIYAHENVFGMQFIPTIEYLGENIDFTDFADAQKPSVSEGTPNKANVRTNFKPKLTLITKEKTQKDVDPDSKK